MINNSKLNDNEQTYLFQSREAPETLFAVIARDYKVAHFRAQSVLGPKNTRYISTLSSIEAQAILTGGKALIKAVSVY